ncbi:MAG: STM4015 family protein [Pseudomonadota bacterium]
MTISDSTETFFNKKVVTYDAATAVDLSNNVVYRLALDSDEDGEMPELIEQFLAKVDKSQLDSLIIGAWGDPYETGADDIIACLIAHAAELPQLRALFIGDMTYEECEISWIIQGNYTPLLNAFPQLEELRVRGSTDLVIEPFTHPALCVLTIECGGFPAEVAEALAASSMPNLTRLELWLGTDDYGFEGDAALYRRLFAKLNNPGLKYLGLRNSDIADELAQWLAGEEAIAQLDTLDLSMGTIGDVGAEALCNSAHVPKLRCLNLSHHYISAAWQQKLKALPIEVLLDDEQDGDEGDDDDRYVAVGE